MILVRVVVGGGYHQKEGWRQPRRIVAPVGGLAREEEGGGKKEVEKDTRQRLSYAQTRAKNVREAIHT